MKQFYKVSILMAITFLNYTAYTIAIHGAKPTNENTEKTESKSMAKIGIGKAAAGPKKSGPAGAAALGSMMAEGSQSSDSGGSGGGSGSGSSSTPTTPPTTPTTAPADQTGQQYAAAPNTGVPTTVSMPTPPTMPTPPADVENTDKKTEDTSEKKSHDDLKNNDPTKNEDTKIPVELMDQNIKNITNEKDVLDKLEEINELDLHNKNIMSKTSLDLLFNNFIYFKDFIVQNFEKNKLIALFIQFIDQIYPAEHAKVISIENNIKNTASSSDIENKNQDQEESPVIPTPTTNIMPNQAVDTNNQQNQYPDYAQNQDMGYEDQDQHDAAQQSDNEETNYQDYSNDDMDMDDDYMAQ